MRLPQIDAEIARLRTRIDILLLEKASVRRQLDSITYPVLSLPREVTSEIFLRCLPVSPDPYSSLAPMLLTQVCHEWSVIALSTPRLWKSLDVYHSTGFIELVKTWFSRSGSLSLTLRVHADEDIIPFSDLKKVLVRYASRFEVLEINNLDPGDMADIGALNFPRLKKLALYPCTDEQYWEGPPVLAFSHAISLQTVILEKLGPSSIRLPWQQLTKVFVDKMAPRECAELLRHATNLIHFRCIFREATNDIISPVPPNLSLRYLSVGPYSEDLLSRLTLPNLQHLTWDPEDIVDFPLEVVMSLLSRSSCSLQRLSLDDCCPNIMQTLRTMPSTPELCFLAWGGDPFNELPSLKADLIDLPNLTHLEFRLMEDHDDSSADDFAVALVEPLRILWTSRSATHPLQSVIVSFHDKIPPSHESLEELRALANDGVNITLVTETSDMQKLARWKCGCERSFM